MSSALVEVCSLRKHFPVQKGWIVSLLGRDDQTIRAVDGVSFSINEGEIFGLVGESGSGKTTIGRVIVGLEEPTAGTVRFEGKSLSATKGREWRTARYNMQMIFQDPFASLNPRMKVGEIIGEGLELRGAKDSTRRIKSVFDSMNRVGLTPPELFADRYPHELSGGQRQRVGVARAITVRPRFIVADEPVSSLDVSIRAQILNLMLDLKNDLGLTYLLISHDMTVVKYMSDNIAVMYLGKIVEVAPTNILFSNPQHPYTKALLSAIPKLESSEIHVALEGEIPSPVELPTGCRFNTRCPVVYDRCYREEPPLVDTGQEHKVACWRT